ncbi:hypothetical protein NWE55_04885 [Myroides albus]|uniref:Lipoprotein n=1 Tax=Myroides albus TaxID=2562892 RepID=A0A6I3LMC6_9FLAO|nr:hypothetical protein [Myroides albus]MTG97322.1 hypothetical protein [Myroides albus]UVD80591.1 hypothetical protein NWE55_04885 [Myroides albus]
MKFIFFLSSFILLISCSKQPNKLEGETKLSYYYWKTTFELDSIEKQSIQELNVTKLYMRYFDVAMQNDVAIPISPILFKEKVSEGISIVPVVYIKNEVMLRNNINLQALAQKIVHFIKQVNERNALSITEVQLDCDWSLQSRENFFTLIEEIKRIEQWKVSSTIRLHQIKYAEKTGIPNVDHGVLMYYNMGSIAADSLNSIYDRNIANKYIAYIKGYPLRLNYALPIYSWLIQSRKGKVVRMISRIRLEDVSANDAFKLVNAKQFEVVKTGDYFGQFFRQGDLIKIESITSEQLLEMKKDLLKVSNACPNEIILYDLNSKNINSYEKEVFKELITCK